MARKVLGGVAALSIVAGIVVTASLGSATGAGTVLHFRIGGVRETAVGYNPHSGVPPAVGSETVFVGGLYNKAAQFGKPIDAAVGRILINCTTLVASPTDGICTGIAHVPNGFFTFAGNGAFTNYSVDHYGITGGDGPYANARGQIENQRYLTGGLMTVTLTP